MLDTYAHLFDDDSLNNDGYPVNNYSGLNSLRARLKNRRWDGKSVFDGQPSNGNTQALAAQDIPKSVQDSVPDSGKGKYVNPADGTSTKYIALMQSGNECIGSSIYFFFELGTAG